MKELNSQIIQNKLRNKFLKSGVQMTGPETIFFSNDTKIGKNVTIEPYVVIGSKVKIGNNVIIKSFSHLEKCQIENKVEIGLDNVTFNKTPKKQFFFSNLTGGKELQAEWILTNLKANVGIKEFGSFKTDKINLWGWKHVISPELFFKISVDPKETVEWSRKFDVFKINS